MEKRETKLKTKLFFPFVRMVRALGGKALLAEIMKLRKDASAKSKGKENEALTEEMGVELVGVLIERLPDAENEVMEFLALFTGKSREEIEEQPIEETIGTIKDIVTDPKFLDFFKSAVAK